MSIPDRPSRIPFVDRVERFDVVTSTMELARDRLAAGAAEGTTIVARGQSAGRGRHGKSWHSESGSGLFLTCILRPQAAVEAIPTLSLAAGLGVAEALEGLGVEAVGLKWPNDLVVGDRKLGGILLEAMDLDSPEPSVLVGVGVNLAKAAKLALPDEVASTYVGLHEILDRQLAEEEALGPVLAGLEHQYHQWQRHGVDPILKAWTRRDALLGHRVRAQTPRGAVEGQAEGINQDGSLRVRNADGVVSVTAGAVDRIRPA